MNRARASRNAGCPRFVQRQSGVPSPPIWRRILAVRIAFKFLFLFATIAASFAQSTPSRTKVVFVGTGVPVPHPARSGPATAINGDVRAELVDSGPGVMRRAASAAEKGITAAAPANLTVAFITHLHSDHTLGLPDLIFTGWATPRRS